MPLLPIITLPCTTGPGILRNLPRCRLPRWTVLAGACLGLSTSLLAQPPTPPPLIELLFNEEGFFASSTGGRDLKGTLLVKNGPPADLHTKEGLGVSGSPSDRAFTNFGATQMGSTSMAPGEGGVVMVKDAGLTGLRSFTLQGWYYCTLRPGNFARLFDASGITVYFDGPDGLRGLTLQLGIRSVTAEHVATKNLYQRAKSWNFFAISYDGDVITENIKFYAGSHTDAVELVATFTLRSPSSFNISDFTVGNRADRARPFRGLMDDFRIWDDALVLPQLEAVRKSDSSTGSSIK